MNMLTSVIVIFLIFEGANILILYFLPQSKMGNGMGVFNAYEKSKKYPEIHLLIKYLINWVAGVKLIFVALLCVIIMIGDEKTQLFSVGALIISIASFFWRLFPLIKTMDKENLITPSGYSKTLGLMITSLLMIFIFALAYYLLGREIS